MNIGDQYMICIFYNVMETNLGKVGDQLWSRKQTLQLWAAYFQVSLAKFLKTGKTIASFIGAA